MDYIHFFKGVGIPTQAVALWAGAEVLLYFRKHLFNNFGRWLTPVSMILCMVAWHFVFNELDGGYWLKAWTADYAFWSWAQALIQHGVIANIPFRHLGFILIAAGHLYAFKWQDAELNGEDRSTVDMSGFWIRCALVLVASTAFTVAITPFDKF